MMKKIIITILAVVCFSDLFAVTTYTVIKTGDPDAYKYPYYFDDTKCDPVMYGTLQWAIRKSLDTPGECLIVFNIPGQSPFVILLNYTLPTLEKKRITIDATTQPGYSQGNPQIILDGNLKLLTGLYFNNLGYSGVKGMVFKHFVSQAVMFNYADNFTVSDCYFTENGTGGSKVFPAAIRAVNSTYGAIRGNFIGRDPAGNDMGNNAYGIVLSDNSSSNTIGGIDPNEGNILAKNLKFGVWVTNKSRFNKISGNIIYGSDFAINLDPDGNELKHAPDILDYNDNTYLLIGSSKPYDMIEIFGSNGTQSADEYTTTVQADGNGKWQVFTASNYTYFVATATDLQKNTSVLSGAFYHHPVTTKLMQTNCDISGVSGGQLLTATPVPGAVLYEFHVTDETGVLSENITKNTNSFYLSELSMPVYPNSVYIISVRTKIGNLWGNFGDICKNKTSSSQDISSCKTDTMYYTCDTSLTAHSSLEITIHMPQGITAMPGAHLNSGTVLSFDNSNVSAPVYTITGFSDTLTLFFPVKAGCSTISASTVSYQSLVDINDNSLFILSDSIPFIVQSPWIGFDAGSSVNLNYTHNACSSEPFERTIAYKNSSDLFQEGYFYFIDSIPQTITSPSFRFINNLTWSPNISLIDSHITNRSVIAKFQITNWPGNTDILIHENIQVINISNLGNNYSHFIAYYGCDYDSSLCDTIKPEQAAFVNTNALFTPAISYTLFNPGYDFCWTEGKQRYFKITNSGNCPTDKITLKIPRLNQPRNITEIDTNSIELYADNSFSQLIPYTIIHPVVPSEIASYYFYIVIDTLLQQNDSIFMTYYVNYKCPTEAEYNVYFDNDISVNYENFPVVVFNGISPVALGTPNGYPYGYYMRTYLAHQFFNNLNGVLTGDSLGTHPTWFAINSSTPFSLGNPLINYLDSSRIITELELGDGLTYTDSMHLHSNITGQDIYPESDTILSPYPDTRMRFVFAFPSNFSSPYSSYDYVVEQLDSAFTRFFYDFEVRFKLTPMCPAPAGKTAIKEKIFYTPKYSCDSLCLLPLASVADSVFVTCPGCLLPGWNLESFTIKRTNFGYRDNNDNNFPDTNPLLSADQSLANKYKILAGDTIEYNIIGHTSDGENWRFDNVGFPFRFNQLYINGPLNNFLKFIDGDLLYIQNNDTESVHLPHSAARFPSGSGTFYFDLSMDTLHNYGLNANVDTVKLYDKIIFKPKFRVYRNLVNVSNPATFISEESLSAQLLMSGTFYNAPNTKQDANMYEPVFDTLDTLQRSDLSYFCTGWEGRILAVGTDFYNEYYNVAHSITASNCYNTLYHYILPELGQEADNTPNNFNAGLTIGDNNAWNSFPFELRNLWQLDSVTITYPPEFTVDKIFIQGIQLSRDSITGFLQFTSPLGSAPVITYDMNNAAFGNNSVTFYPNDYLDTVSSYMNGYSTWGEVKRMAFSVYYKLNDCHPDTFEIASAGYEVPANVPYSAFPANCYYYFSDFPGTSNGDTVIVKQNYNNSQRHFTVPSAMLSVSNVNSVYNNGNFSALLNMDVVDRFNPNNNPLITYQGDLGQARKRTDNTFIYFSSPGGNVIINSVQVNSVNVPVAVDTSGNPINISGKPLYALGNLFLNVSDADKSINLDAAVDCSHLTGNKDSIKVIYGWNCFNYPTDFANACYVDSTWLRIDIPVTGLTVGLNMQDSISFCDTLWTDIKFRSTGSGEVHGMTISLPVSTYYGYSGITEINYHGTIYTNVQPQIVGQNYIWNLDTLPTNGFELDSLVAHIGFLPGCALGNDSIMSFHFSGINSCNVNFFNDTLFLSPYINNSQAHDSLTVYAITPVYNTCLGSSVVSFVVVNSGLNVSGVNQLNIELPTNFVYLSGDPYSQFSNNQYMFNLPPVSSGDSTIISFSILDTNSLITGTYPGTALLVQPVTCHSVTCNFIYETYGFSIPVNSQLVTATAGYNAPVCEGSALNLSSGGGDYYSWSGTGGFTANIPNPVIQPAGLSNTGLYSVTVTDTYGCSDTASVWVVVSPLPTAGIIISDTNCIKQGVLVQFYTGSQTGEIHTWDFGDGSTATGDSVSHVYNDFGYFRLSLTASNSCGSDDSCKMLFVSPPTYDCTTLFDVATNTVITGTVTWDNILYPSGVKVKGDVYVAGGAKLYISNTTARFAPKAKLIIRKGGRVYMNNSTLTSLNGTDMWQGVEVWGVSASPSTDSLQGRIIMNQSNISNAYIGVLLGTRIDYTCSTVFTAANGGFSSQKSGGVIIARNSVFNKNATDIRFVQKVDTNNTANVLENLNFYCNAVLADTHYDPLATYHYPSSRNPWATFANDQKRTFWGIVSVDMNGLHIKGCNFRNLEYGISSLSNKQTYVDSCSFRSLRQGIHIDNYLPTVLNFYDITRCTFDSIPGNTTGNSPHSLPEDNGTAIYIAGGIGDKVYDGNDFRNWYSLNFTLYHPIGIKTNQSTGFEITNNNFFQLTTGIAIQNSGANGGNIMAKASSSIYSWQGNVFTTCRTGITTKEINSFLCLRCNDHTDNTNYPTDTCWINKPSGILADQGADPGTLIGTSAAVKYGAGNRFLINSNKRFKTALPYRYYHHIDANTIPDTIGPITRINVGWNNTGGKINTCPFPSKSPINTLPVSMNDPVFLRLDSFANVISNLESQYLTLVNNADKGQTQQLLDAINADPPSGQLKNMLLADSPLSDEVLIALNTQFPLSNGNYKIVMEENLPVTRNVVPSFNSRVETLPPGIKNQLKAKQASNPGNITIGYLETILGQTKLTRQMYFNEIISLLLSPAYNRKADAITLFEKEGTPTANMVLAATYMSEGNYTLAASKIALLPNDDPQFAEWKSYATLLLNQFTQGKTLEELDENQVAYIRTIAYECPEGMATINAKAVLSYLFAEQVPACPENGTRSMKFVNNTTVKEKLSYLGDNYPDPFSRNTVIPYYLPEGSKGEIIIKDVTGRIILTLSLQEGENKLEIDSKGWVNGVYFYGMSINGENIENKKMVKTE